MKTSGITSQFPDPKALNTDTLCCAGELIATHSGGVAPRAVSQATGSHVTTQTGRILPLEMSEEVKGLNQNVFTSLYKDTS